MIVYVSGALHGSSDLEAARVLYDETARAIEELGATAYLPHKQTDPIRAADMSSDLVFKRDLQAIERAAAVVAYLNEPSHGVGAEVAMCLEWGKPILPVLSHERKCSRFVEGLLRAHGREIVRYADMADLIVPLREFIASVSTRKEIDDTIHTLAHGT